MVKNSKQDWTVGATVKVGFLSLVVRARIPTPGDFLPDAYILTNAAGDRFYRFVPHNGLTSITADEVRADLNTVQRQAQKARDAAIAKAQASAANAALFDEVAA